MGDAEARGVVEISVTPFLEAQLRQLLWVEGQLRVLDPRSWTSKAAVELESERIRLRALVGDVLIRALATPTERQESGDGRDQQQQEDDGGQEVAGEEELLHDPTCVTEGHNPDCPACVAAGVGDPVAR